MMSFDDVLKIGLVSIRLAQIIEGRDDAAPDVTLFVLGDYHDNTPLDLDRLCYDVFNDRRERFLADFKRMTIGAYLAEGVGTQNLYKSIYRLEK